MSIAMHSYEEIRLALASAGAADESAELHGGVCAGLCVGGIPAAEAWSNAWLGDGDGDAIDDAPARELVRSLQEDSWRAMNSGEFALELVLPDDETDIGERVASLAAWCHGFVSGLGVAGLSLIEYEPETRAQLEEIITDFGEIAQASTDVEDAVEAGFQLAAVVEFVRAGVQIVFESVSLQRTARLSTRFH